MLIDEATITVQSGKGGNGSVSFFPGKKSGPSGGDGGRGGDVYAYVNNNLSSLYPYTQKKTYKAQDGGNGMSFNKTGKDGTHLLLGFPPGTELSDHSTGKKIELPMDGTRVLLCVGGRGGYGNDRFKSPTNRSPMKAEKGAIGQTKTFKVIMKLIADVGFIGLPNAGKSSLLNELTAAHAKIAPFPFTTIEPNLGALEQIVLADIPGLIEGASKGKGLGITFLKHIEKVKLLIHCIACDEPLRQMKKNYSAIRKELAEFSSELLIKKELILLTKSDLILPVEREKKLTSFRKINNDVYCISVYDIDAIENFKKILISEVSSGL
ncbi:MAG: GTPase ObgE [Patescibacteria group bacterium]